MKAKLGLKMSPLPHRNAGEGDATVLPGPSRQSKRAVKGRSGVVRATVVPGSATGSETAFSEGAFPVKI